MSWRARIRAAVRAGWQRVVGLTRGRSLRLFALFGLPYVATVASLGSYLLDGGTGPPTRLEFGLLVLAVGTLLVTAFSGAALRG